MTRADEPLLCEACEDGLLLPLECARCRAPLYRCDSGGCIWTDLFGPMELSSWRAPETALRYARCPCCSYEALMPTKASEPCPP